MGHSNTTTIVRQKDYSTDPVLNETLLMVPLFISIELLKTLTDDFGIQKDNIRTVYRLDKKIEIYIKNLPPNDIDPFVEAIDGLTKFLLSRS